MSVEFPKVPNVFLGRAYFQFRRLLTCDDPYPFSSVKEGGLAFCQLRQYLKLTNTLGFCPFTSMLEKHNAYFVRLIHKLPTEDQLHAIVQQQEEATMQLVQFHDLQEVMSVPPITTVVAFAHPRAYEESFLKLLENMRKAIRSDMILRKRAVAIAHPLHPLGGNADGTDKSERQDKPLFISPIPLMDMRYLHPMDIRFGYEGRDLEFFKRVFPDQ